MGNLRFSPVGGILPESSDAKACREYQLFLFRAPYAVEGDFIVEVGQERFNLKSGDSLFAPRKIPHVWAYVGDTRGRMLITFMPAGKMEAFFRKVTQANTMPPQDPELWYRHGMDPAWTAAINAINIPPLE